MYPTFRKRIDDRIEELIRKQVTPWVFMSVGPPLRIKTFDGREIAYQGISFEGSPRNVFWSRYIEPFLEEICISEIAAAVAMARERGVDARLLLPEVRSLLAVGIARVFIQMADVDRRLLRKGRAERLRLRSVDREIGTMTGFVEERIGAELAMWKPKSRVELWYESNKFWVWAIGLLGAGLLAAAAGILAKLL